MMKSTREPQPVRRRMQARDGGLVLGEKMPWAPDSREQSEARWCDDPRKPASPESDRGKSTCRTRSGGEEGESKQLGSFPDRAICPSPPLQTANPERQTPLIILYGVNNIRLKPKKSSISL